MSGNAEAAQVALAALKRQGVNATLDTTASPLAQTSTITEYKSKPATAQRLAALLRLDPATTLTNATDANAPADIVVNLGRNYNACQR
jgi:hypothetical protein